ncbi:MAG: site-specific DNA-methyltransferase [Mogibacterium sp.]|nr:site-specific DNA-methyltransferase [Mogibacterium sp.]
MSLIQEIARGLENGRAMAASASAGAFCCAEHHVFDPSEAGGSAVACGDNLHYMKWLLDQGYAGRFQTIYIDPPFFSKSKYDAVVSVRDAENRLCKIRHQAYDDTFDRSLESYVTNMTARLLLMKELLSDDGLLWVHLDWHSSHYLKLVMDELFGPKNFQNEIIWKYKSGGSGKRHFSRKHDTILIYSKTPRYYLNVPQEKSYNRGLKPYRFKGVKEYRDEYGWYTMVNMKDVWSIDMVGRTSKERTGYATQKPLELMRRIVEASSEPGDLVGDFFCGSGSFLEAAARLGRSYIGCDREELAVAAAKKRLNGIRSGYEYHRTEAQAPLTDRCRLEVLRREELESGKYLYTAALTEFRPELDEGHIPIRDRGDAVRILQEDPMKLIDYIMIDPGGQDPFSADVTVTEDWDCIRFISAGSYTILIVDVFGKEYLIHG